MTPAMANQVTPLSSRMWCECPDAPLYARGPATLLDHPLGCEFPVGVCTDRAHRVTIHAACGRPLQMRFCRCSPSGYTLDLERGWWVHYSCGWPTRAWFEGSGRPAPDDLLGVRPVTYHEFVAVPRNPRSTYDRLTEEQKRLNGTYGGSWVRD